MTQTTEPIPVAEPCSYTTYAHPVAMGDGKVLVLKEDFDHPSALYEVDVESGQERRVAYTGLVSSRPKLSTTGRLWWTEYRQSALFAEKVHSQLSLMDVKSGRIRSFHKYRNVLYPTPLEGDCMAWVEYTPDGRYTIYTNDMKGRRRRAVPYGSEIHGMAWDDVTRAIYVIVTDDDGMYIARVDEEGLTPVTRAAYTTLSDLSASKGKLYFGSIASGCDELHSLDLASGKQTRLSTSKYGSFQPSPLDEDRVVAVSYDKRGYMPVTQSVKGAQVVAYSNTPRQIMLPEGKRWGVVNLDTVRFDAVVKDSVVKRTPPRRFNRFLHAFNIHSWAPASYDPYAIVEESSIAFNLGATIMSQNILSTLEGFLTWGWNPSEGSVYKGMLTYNGLGVNMWVRATYGGNQQIYRVVAYDKE